MAQPEFYGEITQGLERYLKQEEVADVEERNVFLDLFYPPTLSNTLKQSFLVDRIDPFAFENLTGNMIIMLLVALITALIVLVAETGIFCSCRKATSHRTEDPKMEEDVLAEQERLELQTDSVKEVDDSSGDPADIVRLLKFRKAYTRWFGKPFLAVENISFGLNRGECFALLGVNGAGKSTTFKSLTRDVLPTSGDVSIAGYDVVKKFAEARRLIGYCP